MLAAFQGWLKSRKKGVDKTGAGKAPVIYSLDRIICLQKALENGITAPLADAKARKRIFTQESVFDGYFPWRSFLLSCFRRHSLRMFRKRRKAHSSSQ